MKFANPSSNIASAAYDAETKALTVTFNGGGVYRYKDVPAEVAAAFEAAESPGKYLNANIKGLYDFEKV